MSTDVMGYRSDTGALGQDQQVSGQLRAILTSKLPLLSSPGSVIENSLYYDVTSSSVAAVEMQATFAKDRIVMSNMQMGAAPTAYIPSQLFAGTVFWVAQLPDIFYPSRLAGDTDNGNLRFYAPLGWGFAAIQSVIVYMGASSIAQIEIDWYANLLLALACCETDSKKESMLKYAGMLMDNYAAGTAIQQVSLFDTNDASSFPRGGQSIFTPYGASSAAMVRNNWSGAGAGINQVEAYYVPASTACVPIRLPFTSMATLEKKLSLDTKLLTQPIQITLQTKQATSFLKVGSSLATPVQWSNSTLQLWQEELSDKSLSVRNDLLAMPEFNVGYPFQYTQSIPFSFPSGASGDGNITFNGNSYNQQQVTINVTSIINSDLTTMLFSVTNNCRATTQVCNAYDNAGAVIGDCNQFCPLMGEQLSNISLLLNGQRFFAFDQGIYPGVSLSKQLAKVAYRVPIPYYKDEAFEESNNVSLHPDSVFKWVDSYVYELNFSRLRSIIAESHLQNTARFTNQTFQLTFNIERSSNYITPPDETLASYQARMNNGMQLHMVYLYNGVFLIGGDGGTTKLVTN